MSCRKWTSRYSTENGKVVRTLGLVELDELDSRAFPQGEAHVDATVQGVSSELEMEHAFTGQFMYFAAGACLDL